MINKVNRQPPFVRKGKYDFYVRYIFDHDSRFRDLGKSVTASITSFHFPRVGTLRIRVNTKCSFKMPFVMILLLRDRVSISDGKAKIDTGNQCSPR